MVRHRTSSFSNSVSLGLTLADAALFYDLPLSDALAEAIEATIPPGDRPSREFLEGSELKDGSQDTVIKELVSLHSWRALARYAATTIMQTAPSHPDQILSLWYLRIYALTQLRLYQIASAELEKLGNLNRAELLYDYHPGLYPGKKGSMVPFELKVLSARIRIWLGDAQGGLTDLWSLIMECEQHSENCEDESQAAVWKTHRLQVFLIIANQFIREKEYALAIEILDQVAAAAGPDDADVLGAQLKLFLQLGDTASAHAAYTKLEALSKRQSSDDTHSAANEKVMKERLGLYKAFLLLGDGDWSGAKQAFEDVLQLNRLSLVAANNLAVCCLYLGNLNEAVKILEELLDTYPTAASNCETLVFNLCTLYELRSDTAMAKKQAVLKEVAAWAGDDFTIDCLKIPVE